MLGGVFLMVTALLKFFFKMNQTTELTLSLFLVFGVVAVLILSTEKAIKINFPKANEDVD